VKIALAQLNYHIGNFSENVSKIKHSIERARSQGADLVIFAELAISGYPPRDFLEFEDFIERCTNAANDIARECTDIAAIIGCPVPNNAPWGKDLFNAALFLAEGKIVSVHAKALLPNYDVFDEYRYFEPGKSFTTASLDGKKIAITVCEDLWNIGPDLLYSTIPMDELSSLQPDLIVNIAASPFHYKQAEIRTGILRENAIKYSLPVFYVNQTGAQTDLLFDGGSMVLDARGNIRGQMKYFKEDMQVFDLEEISKAEGEAEMPVANQDKIALIHDALVMGIENYFEKLNFGKAVLGLSGGIDSAVTLVLAAEALGADNVWAVLLPSHFSSEHSIADAVELAENLGCPYDTIPISTSYASMEETLRPWFGEMPFDLAEENMQARIRGVLLMALSNKFGHILLNTSNKSEAAVGYGTLYGDMNGGISVLGDVYKTQVYQLARYINREKEIIPENTIVKPPSAELRPGQKDSDSLPPYNILDELLYQYIELRQGPKKLISMGFKDDLVYRILRMVNTNEYKRYQTPPILRISSKAFGIGRRMPIVARYLAED
jgi:NAD+ synthase (glutamine-hydrolysing)